MVQSSASDYLLGVNEKELERLRFQHSVWEPVTNRFFNRLGVAAGWRCLDVGAGPGFVAMDLRVRVGEGGEVVALEPSDFYHRWLRGKAAANSWTNLLCVRGVAEDAPLQSGYFDLIYIRWVLSFVADPERILTRLFTALKPGGIIAVQDYYYEGLSLFPRGGAFDRMPDAVREYYRRGGGDPYVTGKIPPIFRKHGLALIDFSPVSLAGGPDSGIIEWAHRFFTVHTQAMVDKGIVSQAEGEAILADWLGHRNRPETLFFSPIVVDIAGRLNHPSPSG